MNIFNNTTSLQEILEAVNNLPDASSGVELPDLNNPANADEIFLNKEVIDENGKVKTGTFTIDAEIETQDSLIEQIRNTANSLPEVESGGSSFPYTITVNNNADLPHSIFYDNENTEVIVVMPNTLGQASSHTIIGGDMDESFGTYYIYYHIINITDNVILSFTYDLGDVPSPY